MNLFQKTFNTVAKAITGNSITDYSGILDGGTIQVNHLEDMNDIKAQTTYKQSLYITSGLRIIKDTFSAVEFQLFEITSIKGELKPVEIHPIIDILYKPNPLQTKLEFWRLIAESFIVSKDVYIRLVLDRTTPKYFIILNPAQVQVKFNQATGTLNYVYSQQGGEQIVIPSEEMVHIKDADLSNQLSGRSDLAPILERARAEASATSYQRGMFARNGNPDAILNFPDVTETEDLLKIKAGIKNSFNGKNDDMRIAVVGGNAELSPMGTATVLDYKASQELIRDDIMMALGVPKALVTSDDVNRANADAALEQFMRFLIVPMYKLVLEAINERFVIPYYGEKYYLSTENLVNENKELLFKELQIALGGRKQILTVNEARTRLGYETVDGKDDLTEAQGLQLPPQEAKRIFKTRSTLYAELKIKDILETAKKKAKAKQLAKAMQEDNTYKVKFSKAIDASRARADAKLKKETTKFLKEQYKRILTNLDKAGDDFTTAGDLFKYKQELEETAKYITPVYVKVAEDAGNTALTPVKMLSEKQNDFVMNSRLFKKIEDRASLFSAQISKTTYDALSEIVADNVQGGVKEIKKALEASFYENYIGRAETIARTESSYMTSLGTQMAYDESEIVSGKQWFSTLDAVVRPEHQIDGEIVDKQASFSNGEDFPGDGSVNCRCAMAAVVDLTKL